MIEIVGMYVGWAAIIFIIGLIVWRVMALHKKDLQVWPVCGNVCSCVPCNEYRDEAARTIGDSGRQNISSIDELMSWGVYRLTRSQYDDLFYRRAALASLWLY